MRSDTFHGHTGSREAVHDISRECASSSRRTTGRSRGCCTFVPHTTAGIAILEPAPEPDDDLLAAGTLTRDAPMLRQAAPAPVSSRR